MAPLADAGDVTDDVPHLFYAGFHGDRNVVLQLHTRLSRRTHRSHYPGPRVLAVTAGEVTVFETDCTPRGFFAEGDGFFDTGTTKPRNVHTLYNPPGNGVAELVITDFREEVRS